jgi:hypothetical protein
MDLKMEIQSERFWADRFWDFAVQCWVEGVEDETETIFAGGDRGHSSNDSAHRLPDSNGEFWRRWQLTDD